MKFTLHSPPAEAKKKSHNRPDALPEFSASLSPLLTQPIRGASSTRTETFSIEPPNADVTTRYAPKRQQAPVPDQTPEGSPGWFGKKTPPKPEGTLPRAPRGALGTPPSLLAPLALLQPLLSSKATEPTPSSSSWGPGACFPTGAWKNPQPSSPTALSAARRSPQPGARAGSLPPRARRSGCVQGAE